MYGDGDGAILLHWSLVLL